MAAIIGQTIDSNVGDDDDDGSNISQLGCHTKFTRGKHSRLYLVGIISILIFVVQLTKFHSKVYQFHHANRDISSPYFTNTSVIDRAHFVPMEETKVASFDEDDQHNSITVTQKIKNDNVPLSSTDSKLSLVKQVTGTHQTLTVNSTPILQSRPITTKLSDKPSLKSNDVTKSQHHDLRDVSKKSKLESSKHVSTKTKTIHERKVGRKKQTRYNEHGRKDNRVPSSKSHLVVIGPKELFMWNGAQSRLCSHIKKEISSMMKNSTIEKKKKNPRHPSHANITLAARIPCLMIHNRNQHGNFMVGFYGMRLAAMAFNASFIFQCSEWNPPSSNQRSQNQLQQQDHQRTLNEQSDKLQESFLWWFQSYRYMASKQHIDPIKIQTNGYAMNHSIYNPSRPTKTEACKGMGKIQLHYISEYARRDLRSMALDISQQQQQMDQSLFDDVAIHWRCGDVLSGKIPPNDNNYGLLQFRAYKKHIPDTVQTIGIVTAPFESKHSRDEDRQYGHTCKYIAGRLVTYLQTHFPHAKITIRNDPKETIPMVLSRLILAKFTFCVRSTFCLFPAIASFGNSYVQRDGVAYFFDPIVKAYDNIHLIDEPFLRSHETVQRGINQTVQWLLSSD